MANYYVSSVAYAAIAQWAAGHTYSVGNYVRQLAAPAAGNERVFKATSITTGVSGGSEPAWNLGDNATTTDGGVTWTQIAGHEAEQSAGNWKAAAARINAFPVAGLTNSDTVFVSSDHDEQWTADPAYNFAPSCISVSRVGASLPPVSADITAGAKIEWITNAGTLTLGFQSYMYGFSFIVGGGSNSASLQIRGRAGDTAFDTCNFTLTNTNTASRIKLGIAETNGPFRIKFTKPVFKFANSTQKITFTGTDDMYIIGNGATIIDAGGTMPTNLIDSSSAANLVTFSRCDLSNFSGTNLFLGGSVNWNTRGISFIDCKMPAGFSALPNTAALSQATFVRFWNCDDGNRTYRFYETVRGGSMQSTENAGRVGGASDGTNTLCWQLNPTVQNSYWMPYTSPPIAVRITSTGSSKTATIHAVSTAVLNTANSWLSVSTLDDSGDTLGATHTTQAADVLTSGSTYTTTTEDWTANTTARQNSHAYSIGDTYKASTNPGRLFICTTAGTSAGSEPAAVASATDGSAFSDGTATIKCMRRYKLAVTWTPARIGVIRAHYNQMATISTIVTFVDPKIIIT